MKTKSDFSPMHTHLEISPSGHIGAISKKTCLGLNLKLGDTPSKIHFYYLLCFVPFKKGLKMQNWQASFVR